MKKILICITGGIAVYKVCSLVNNLIKDGMEVRVVMTDAATKFVTPLTFQSLTNYPVYLDIWNPVDRHAVEHIAISHWPDVILVAPATANTISKISLGIADNLVTTLILASLKKTPIIIAPAMNVNMWDNDLFQSNLRRLTLNRKYIIVEPRSGILACRDEGTGKIALNEEIITKIKLVLTEYE